MPCQQIPIPQVRATRPSSSSNVLTLTAKAAGSTSNYSLSANDTYNTSLFQGPSFVPAAFGFSLTGGCNADSITVTYGIYRRTGMCDAAGAEAWSYDSMGRVLTDQRNTNGINKTATYAFDVGGDVTTLTYPTGRVTTYTLASSGTSTAARLLSAVDTANSINYATGAHYSPAGALAALTNGNGTGIVSTFLFNSRLQPCWMYATTGTPLPWNSSSTNCTTTAATGSLLDLKYNFNLAVSDNGNLVGITNNVSPDRSQGFTYDSLNRISTAQTNGTFATSPTNCWAETYNYDAWGNLLKLGPNSSTQSAYTGCSQESGFDYTNFTNTKNQITYTGFSYDSAGNLTTPPGAGTANYNAANQLVSAGGVSYLYDGDGKRVQKSNGTMYWYGINGDPLDETDLTGSFTNGAFHEYIFFAGARIARRDSSNSVQYYFADHLGSSRIVANSSGGSLDNSDFYPFGGERQISSSSGNRYKFTAKERDTESVLDYFGARQNSPSIGRFVSPDWSDYPEPVPYAELTDPQSLNLYSYTENNPLNLVDDDGHDNLPIPPAKCGLLCKLFNFIFGGDGKRPLITVTFTPVQYPFPPPHTVYAPPFPMQPGVNYGHNPPGKYLVGGCPGGTCHNFDGAFPPLERNLHPIPWLLMGLGGVLGARSEGLTIEKIYSNPNVLNGMAPEEVEAALGNPSNWSVERLGEGEMTGKGWKLVEYLKNGEGSGRQIRWHPGGSRHYATPHFTVVQPNAPSIRVPAAASSVY